MTSKDRILKALNNKQPDKVPVFEPDIAPIIITKLARLLSEEHIEVTDDERIVEDSDKFLDLYCYVINKLKLDATCVNISQGLKDIDSKTVQDKFGSIYGRSPHGIPYIIEGPINASSDLKGFDMVSKIEDEDFNKVKYITGKVGDSKFHFMYVTDPLN